jgi:hypothetical protein
MAGPSFLATAYSFPILLVLGILVRAPALWHPVEEGQRNAQTACLTANMVEDGHFRLDPVAPWRGDLEARLVQELPLYNIFILALSQMPGMTLDLAGRLVSLGFWVLGFWLLQSVWRLTLPEVARPWANLLFIFSPMNWYLSTAFMPESLVQLLSIGLILLALHHTSKPTLATAIALVAVALLGLGIKFPSFVHLGLFLALVLVDRLGWRSLMHPVFLGGGCLILAVLQGWSRLMETVNSAYFPYWTGRGNLVGFIMPEHSRLSGHFWVHLLAYNFSLIVPLLAAPWMVAGLVKAWRSRSDFNSRVWLYLLLSLLAGWLLWGKGPAAQSYYNLPNLVCFSAFFGLGVAAMTSAARFAALSLAKQRALGITGAGLLFVWGAVGTFYLSQPDTPTLHAAAWLRTHTKSNALILYQPRHAPAVMDYEHQPLLSYASGRKTWIWTRTTPDWEKEKALKSSSYLVITQPLTQPGFFESLRRSFKGTPPPLPAPLTEIYPKKFTLVAKEPGFDVYRLKNGD